MKQATVNSVHHSFGETTKEKDLDIEWLTLICEAKEMGISLTEIKEFLLDPDTFIRKGQ